jgi:hypothetical protein
MIKIEVTGNSIPEVADKLLAIGASLRSAAINAADDAAREALQAKRNVADAALAVVHSVVEVAEAAPVDPTPAPKSAPVAEVSESQPTTTATFSTPAPAASVSEDEELEVVDLPIATLDIEADVRPLILKVVTARGKPVMEELLSRFGVAKASQIEPALLPELVALMQEALGK